MGKKSSSQPAPAAPDPHATAAAQAAANKEAAVSQANINMVNQYTPYGSLEYSQRGTAEDGTPQYSATQTLSDDQQALYDLGNQAQQQYGELANQQLGVLGDRLGEPLDFSNLGPAPAVNEDTRQQTAQAMYDRVNPQLDRDYERMEARLASQGIGYGSEAYQDAMGDFDRNRNDMRLAIDSQAGNEMSRQFGLEQAARNQGINEMVQQRQIPLNETAALMSGSQVQGPQYVGTPQTQITPAPVAESIYGSYNGQLNDYNARQRAAAAENQGLYGLLGSGLQAGAYAWGTG